MAEKKIKNQKSKVEKKTVSKKSEVKKNIKTITGTVASVKMKNTVVISVTRKVPHKRYGKLMKVTKRIKADTNGIQISEGDLVTIEQTRPISRDKFFKVIKREEKK